MAVKRKGPINVMKSPSKQDLLYIQTCCTEALRQAKEGGLKTFEEFIEKIESVSVTESDKRGYGTTRILEASNRQSQLIIWFKETPTVGYITGEKLAEKMPTGQKYTKNEIEKSLNSQQLETESNTTKSVQKLHIRQEKEQAEKLRKIVVEERGVVHKAQEFGEDLARGKGPLNGIQITGLAIGGVTSLISGIQALSSDREAEELLALSKKLDRIKNKSKELEGKKEKLVQEMGSDRASSELAKERLTKENTPPQGIVEPEIDSCQPSFALSSYIESCTESKFSDPYLKEVTKQDYQWLLKTYKEYLKEDGGLQFAIEKNGIDRVTEQELKKADLKVTSFDSRSKDKDNLFEFSMGDSYEYFLEKNPTIGVASVECIEAIILDKLQDKLFEDDIDSAQIATEESQRRFSEIPKKYGLDPDSYSIIFDKAEKYIKENQKERERYETECIKKIKELKEKRQSMEINYQEPEENQELSDVKMLENLLENEVKDQSDSKLDRGSNEVKKVKESKTNEQKNPNKEVKSSASNARESENKLDENRSSSSSVDRETDRDKTVTEAEQEEQTNQTKTAIPSEKAEQPLSQENIEKIPSESSQNSNQTESNKDNGNNNQFRTTSDILEFLSKEVDSVNQRVATLVEQEKAESIEENLNEGMSFNQKIEYLNQILDGVENKLQVFESQLDQLVTTEQRITGLSSKTEKAAERATDITNNKGQINQHKSKVEKVEENLDNLTEKNEANRTEQISEKVEQVANNKTVKKENTNDLTPEFVRSLYRMAKHNQGNLEELTPNQAVPIMNCQLEEVQNIERYKGFEYNITGLLNDDYQFEITAEKEGETYFKAIVSLQKKDGNSVVIETDQLPEEFKKVCTKDLIKGLKQRESKNKNQSKTPEKSQNREAELVN